MRRWKTCWGLSVPALALCVLAGVALGTGTYTVRYAEGFSYLSSDPKACVNCHITREQYDARNVDAEAMKEAMALQRKAQWRVDFINAENSMGFHAPQESARILGEAIDGAPRPSPLR